MKNSNYLERIRFAIEITNLKEHSPDWINPNNPNWDQILDPCISIGIDSLSDNITDELLDRYILLPGTNTLIFDYTVYNIGEHQLKIKIHDIEKDNWLLPPIQINKLRMQSIPVLPNGIYYPADSNEELPGARLLGQRGEWKFTFTTPVKEAGGLKIGLWS